MKREPFFFFLFLTSQTMADGSSKMVSFISVVIPVYNGQSTIAQCLEALIRQESVELNVDYEVVVVDDGSIDSTVQIAENYPVRIVSLKKNGGRIIARKTGAEAARGDNILFVDSRVIVEPDLLSQILKINKSPMIAGDLKAKETKYNSIFHTVFYLIRKKIYGKKYFPQQDVELIIDQENFSKAPKGTTILYIEKKLFLAILPGKTDKNTNDDTLIFHKLIFEQKIKLIRHKGIRAEYKQRTELSHLVPWLFQRGTRFADFYCKPGRRFFPFILFGFAAVILAVFLLVFLAGHSPQYLFPFFSVVFAVYFFLALYVSENIRDFLTFFCVVPLIFTIFCAGIVRYLFLMVFRRSVSQ